MKNLILAITLILGINVCAQDEFVNSNVFVRVFDLQDKKIGKGKIFSFSGTALKLSRNGKPVEIPVSNIGTIRTKHSAGNNILIGAASGVVAGAILGSINPPTDSSGGTFTSATSIGGSSGEEFTSGLIVGVISGTIIGGITILFKNSKSYEINGDKAKLKSFKEIIIK